MFAITQGVKSSQVLFIALTKQSLFYTFIEINYELIQKFPYSCAWYITFKNYFWIYHLISSFIFLLIITFVNLLTYLMTFLPSHVGTLLQFYGLGTWEETAINSRPTWSISWVPGQLVQHREAISQTNK